MNATRANGGEFTTAPVTAGQTVHRPEFIRLPKPGSQCIHTGLTRSKLNELILPSESNGFAPPVRSVCLRKRGAAKGVRLIAFDSLIAHLHRHIDGGAL